MVENLIFETGSLTHLELIDLVGWLTSEFLESSFLSAPVQMPAAMGSFLKYKYLRLKPRFSCLGSRDFIS